MLSTRLLQRVEAHWESIAKAVIEQTRIDPNTPHHQELADAELYARVSDLVQHLGTWLSSDDAGKIYPRYEEIGAARFTEGIPLAEMVYRIQLIEAKTLDYIQQTNAAQSAVEIFGELEMVRALHRFVGIVIHAVVKGYEREAHNAWLRRACA
jgi:hypothetical protein